MRPAGPILVEGRTCARRARANRVSFLIDGSSYFSAVARAFDRAERVIRIVGWDFHGGIRLRRSGPPTELPEPLGERLSAAVARRPGLRIDVLEWDFPMVYGFGRDWRPIFESRLPRHRRLRYRLDGRHPLGASHHQKIVVVDDRLAFVGGLDLAACRWDDPSHAPHDPRRSDPGFPDYEPFHDVQMAVDGPVAAVVAEVARERWRRAGAGAPAPGGTAADPWPADLPVDLEDADVGVVLTEPEYAGRPAIRQGEALYVEAIRAAQRWIYCENQYLTAARVCDALVERLAEPDGPEVVIVQPRSCSGWLEERVMGGLRARVLERLSAADREHRLRVFIPSVPDLGDRRLNVHAKLMIVDGRFVRIGSSNLANRSMGFDTECDLAVEAGEEEAVARAILRLQARLLAEHLDASSVEQAGAALRKSDSLIETIDALRDGPRTLEPFATRSDPWADELPDDLRPLDPERPVDLDALIRLFRPGRSPSPRRGRPGRLGAAAAGAFVVVTASPLGAILSRLLSPAPGWTEWVLAHPAVIACGFLAATVAFAPLAPLTVAAVLLLGPFLGGGVSLVSALAGVTVSYALGARLPRDHVRRIAGRRLERITQDVVRSGAVGLFAAYLLPSPPSALVALVAGASGVPPSVFVRATASFVLATVAAFTLLGALARVSFLDPGPAASAAFLAYVGSLSIGVGWLRTRTRRGADRRFADAMPPE